MHPANLSPLPIDNFLDAITASFALNVTLVLVAPPGAGKTTRVPLHLLNAPFLHGKKIILLEPRRLAARAAAARMAESLGEEVGATIGLRVRLQSQVSAKTRIEVVTEGVFTRMILDNFALDGIGMVIFDEFHERSLDADFGLALARDVQQGLREDLAILIMSATLDGARIARLLNHAPVIESAGRMFPITTHYISRDPQARIEAEVARVILRAIGDEEGSILAFLPGQAEILRTAALLKDKLRDASIDIVPLYGAMDRSAQDRAIAPVANGRRKIVLATSIAETSLTIEGVRIVVDCGLARVPIYEPDMALTRFATVRVSRAAANQRRGRAGRTQPGVCYRLWEEAATGGLPAFNTPEILSADLSGLVLDLASLGVRDPTQLTWLDPPPPPALAEARTMLTTLGALDAQGNLGAIGPEIRALGLPPRLARMVVMAKASGDAALAADLAVVMVERGLGGTQPDVAQRIELFRQDRSARAQDARQLARRWVNGPRLNDLSKSGSLLALAFPDRIAKARGKLGHFIMRNGRAASLEPHEALASAPYLAIGEIVGRAGAARIMLAAPLSLDDILAQFGGEVAERIDTLFDTASASLRARRRVSLGALVLSETNLAIVPGPETALALTRGIGQLGIARLPFGTALNQWRDRVMFLRKAQGDAWPDVSDAGLTATLEHWLAPHIEARTSLAAITTSDLDQALSALLPWQMAQRLEREAPTHFTTPAGSRIALDYQAEGGPMLSARVQEFFGLNAHPAIAAGKVALTLSLLSPAHRPLQITRDLPGFWAGSWRDVKTEMKGRYPRHPWPDDPGAALPTARAKPRGT